VSTASILVRAAQPAVPSLVIAACRLGIAALVLAPFAVAHPRGRAALRALRPRDLALALLAGACLALHFATWIASLRRTSVLASVTLVTTAPLWVALLSPLVLREPVARRTAAGIAIALAGAALVAAGDAAAHGAAGGAPHALAGDALALAGAWAMAAYLLAGRRLRARLPLVPYALVVYGAAAALLLGAAAVSGAGVDRVPPGAWRWLVLLALVPQLAGHTTFNWALRHLPASLVALALVGEPVGSAALAFALFREVPGPAVLAGAALVLAGIVVAAGAARPAAAA